MDSTMEKLREERRRKARKFMIEFLIVSILLILISPLLSMIAALFLAGSAAYGLSPTMDLYRGFKSSALLSVVSKDAAQEIYKAETEEVKNRISQYGDLIVIIILGFSLFLISLYLMSIGWGGIISLL